MCNNLFADPSVNPFTIRQGNQLPYDEGYSSLDRIQYSSFHPILPASSSRYLNHASLRHAIRDPIPSDRERTAKLKTRFIVKLHDVLTELSNTLNPCVYWSRNDSSCTITDKESFTELLSKSGAYRGKDENLILKLKKHGFKVTKYSQRNNDRYAFFLQPDFEFNRNYLNRKEVESYFVNRKREKESAEALLQLNKQPDTTSAQQSKKRSIKQGSFLNNLHDFLTKEMDEPNPVAKWSEDGTYFIILDQEEFTEKFNQYSGYKAKKFHSFIRQFNNYGLRSINNTAYFASFFCKDDKALLELSKQPDTTTAQQIKKNLMHQSTFLITLYKFLRKEMDEPNPVAKWSEDGTCFTILSEERFIEKFNQYGGYKVREYSSFVRQFNNYGLKGKGNCTYSADFFHRDDRKWLDIVRHKKSATISCFSQST